MKFSEEKQRKTVTSVQKHFIGLSKLLCTFRMHKVLKDKYNKFKLQSL